LEGTREKKRGENGQVPVRKIHYKMVEDEKQGKLKYCQKPPYTNTGLQMAYGWSKEGLKTFTKIAKEIETNRDMHGTEFDNIFKEAMKEKVKKENKKKRKHGGMEVYNDLNKDKWNTEEGDSSEEETQAAKNEFQL
jgi:hypothetical protein